MAFRKTDERLSRLFSSGDIAAMARGCELAGSHSAKAFEVKRKVALVIESHFKRDGGDGMLVAKQELFGALDALLQEELIRGKAGVLFEHTRKVKGTEIYRGSDFGQGKILCQMIGDEELGATHHSRRWAGIAPSRLSS